MRIKAWTFSEMVARARRDEATGCLEWQLHKDPYGYGKIQQAESGFAHRMSYKLNFGEIPKGMLVCHTCDNRCCIEPSHLKLGTHQDNMDDMKRRKRTRPCRGSQNGFSKLSEDQVVEMRRLRALGTRVSDIAVQFNVCHSTALNVTTGKRWKHVGEPS